MPASTRLALFGISVVTGHRHYFNPAWQLTGAGQVRSSLGPHKQYIRAKLGLIEGKRNRYAPASLNISFGKLAAARPISREAAAPRGMARRSALMAVVALLSSAFPFAQTQAVSAATPKVKDYIEAEVDLPLRPKQPLRILQAFGSLRPEDKSEASKGALFGDRTGAFMWPGGVDLARGASTGQLRMSLDGSIASVPIKGKRVLELGAGTGVAGIGAVIGGAGKVVITDGNPELLRVARINVDRNLDNVKARLVTVQRLRWGDADEEDSIFRTGPFDVVLASEVAYEREALAALFGCMRRCMQAATLAGVAAPLSVLQISSVFSDNRRGFEGVLSASKEAGLKVASSAEVGDSNRFVLTLAG